MDIRVSGMVWLPKADLGQSAIADVKQRLTIVPRQPRGYGDENVTPDPIHCWVDLGDYLGVPRQYFAEVARGQHRVSFEFSEGHPIQVENTIRHEGKFEEQEIAVSTIVRHFKSFDGTQGTIGKLGAILKASTGGGKTQMALSIAYRLGVTTMILVHKEFLLKQWVRRIEKLFPKAKVGIVRGPKCKFEGKDFVVGMIQSLAKEDEDPADAYPAQLYEWPGFLILDEVHRVGAPTFSRVPHMFRAKYRLGLTATPRRRDGADKVFWWHIGDIAYSVKTETPIPTIRCVRLDFGVPEFLRKDGISPTVVEKNLAKFKRRNERIVYEIIQAVSSPKERKVMVLSKTLEHLQTLEGLFREKMKERGEEVSTGFYVGQWFTGEFSEKKDANGRKIKVPKKRNLTDAELLEAERARVIFATFAMTAEGVDIPAVDTINMATPIADSEQAEGRARRFCLPDPNDPGKCEHYCPWRAGKCTEKPTPVVTEFVDVNLPLSKRRAAYRAEFHKKIGAKVQTVDA